MSAVEEIVYLLEEAFRGRGIEDSDEAQSLLANLANVDDAAWSAIPGGATRTIGSIVLHVGGCKVMYDDHAFGSASLSWDSPEVTPWPEDAVPRDAAMGWLMEVHDRLVGHVRALTDDDLGRERLANWGEHRATRWLVSMLLQHDTYHAGEINHIRSMMAGDDAWRWQQEG